MSKFVKNLILTELRERIGDTRDFLVINSSELDGVTNNNMRLKLQAQNIRMLGVKNALAKRVLGDLGLQGISPYLKGPSVLVWGSTDIVALSKEIAKWAKDLPKLQVKGGVVEGTSVNAAQVEAISKGPSREETIGRVVMLMLSPGARLAGALLGPGGQLCGQLKAISEKEPEPEAEAPAT